MCCAWERIMKVKNKLLVYGAVFALFAACEQPAGVVRDDDATLRSLSIDAGILRPAFSASCTEYSATVRNAVVSITVEAVANSPVAMVSGKGAKPLGEGPNTVTIGVEAEDGTSKSYTIIVTRLTDSVFEIETAADMAKIGVDWPLAGEYALMEDITLTNWAGIAGTGEVFSGAFDGGGNTITLNGLASGATGIFNIIEGSVAARAIVRNLAVAADVDITLSGNVNVGVITGSAKNVDFEDIIIQGTFSAETAGKLYLGGIAGIADGITITGSLNEAEIYGSGTAGSGAYNQVGGLVGMFQGGTIIKDCHNTGDVTGKTAGGGSNILVGGIAGGSYYDMTTNYFGIIEDCSSSGNIHSTGGGYWSWAGGIAGTIVGYGNGADQRTRISRCHASGRISVKGVSTLSSYGSGSWPYVGGIVGYVYYGALVEQCYFTGDVVVEVEDTPGYKVNDYAGGIAGYNSRYPDNNSTIQDCWSTGTVTGFLNAGGIVGQNQVEAILRRCYSTATVTITAGPGIRASAANQGAGGIAGFSVSNERDALTGCVALNPSVSAPNGFTMPSGGSALGRVIGTNISVYVAEGFESSTGSGNVRNNFARNDMTVTTKDTAKNITGNINGLDGANCTSKPNQAFYVNLGWDFDNVTGIWKMGSDGYPLLTWQ